MSKRAIDAGARATDWLREGVVLAEGQRGEICLEVDGLSPARPPGWSAASSSPSTTATPRRSSTIRIRRRDGTLRAYLRHTVHDDPYRHVGRQDLTAHVDVTAVEAAAQAAGLSHLGTTTQGEFLAGLGAGDLLRATVPNPATTIEEYLTARSSLLQDDRSGGDGTLPGDGVRASMAGRWSGSASLGAATFPDAAADEPSGLGQTPY